MISILEYIKKTKTSKYGPLDIYYKDGQPYGITIENKFILMLKPIGHMSWHMAVAKQDLKDDFVLPTVEQCEIMSLYRDELNVLLFKLGGRKCLISNDYLWTGEIDPSKPHYAKSFFYGRDGIDEPQYSDYEVSNIDTMHCGVRLVKTIS